MILFGIILDYDEISIAVVLDREPFIVLEQDEIEVGTLREEGVDSDPS